MLHVLYGPDRFRAMEELQAIRRGLDRDGNLAHNTIRLEGRTVSPAELRNASQAASFFAEDRLVIVEGLQARLAGSRRRGRRGRADAGGSEPDRFVDVLIDLPPTTTVVLLDDAGATAFLEAVKDAATARFFPVLRGAELRVWAQQRARERGARLEPAALDRLLALVDGFHLGELAQEIDKLATYAGDRQISVKDIDELVSASVHFQTWDLTDMVIEGRGERALTVLRGMDAREYPAQLLIFMLTRQYRQLMLVQALLAEGLGEAQVGTELGVTGYPLRKAVEQAGRYPPARLEAAYRRLLETDVAVKTGVLDADVALEMLVLDLANLARAPARLSASR